MNSEIKKTVEEIWLSTLEVAELLSVTKKAIRKRTDFLRKESTVQNQKGYVYLLSSLPAEAQQKYVAAKNAANLPIVNSEALTSLNNAIFKPEQNSSSLDDPTIITNEDLRSLALEKICKKILSVSRGKKIKLNQATKIVHTQYKYGSLFPELKTVVGDRSVKTFYRIVSEYKKNKKDRSALVRKYKREKPELRKWNAEWNRFIAAEDLKGNNLRPTAIAETVIEYLIINGVPESVIPCLATAVKAVKYYRNNFNSPHTFANKGKGGLFNNNLPSYKRDMSKINIGDVLVLDGKTDNVLTYNPMTGKKDRMIMVAVSCMKSQCILSVWKGWSEDVNTIMIALFLALLVNGRFPKAVYLDNGKAFNAEIFTGEDGIYNHFGIEIINAKVRNARAKNIERLFREWAVEEKKLFNWNSGSPSDMSPANLPGERRLKGVRRDFDSFKVSYEQSQTKAVEIMDKLNNRVRKSRGLLKGFSPQQLFNEGKKNTNFISAEALFMQFTRKMEKRTTKSISSEGLWFKGNYYWNSALMDIRNRSLTMRQNFLDFNEIIVWDTVTGKYLFCCYKQGLFHPLANITGSDADKETLKHALFMRQKLVKQAYESYKILYNAFTRPLIIQTQFNGIDPFNNQKNPKAISEAKIISEDKANNILQKTGTDDSSISIDEQPVKEAPRKPNNWLTAKLKK